MEHVHLTWYVLTDGTHANPNDVAMGADGILRNGAGVAVALHDSGVPKSVGKSPEEVAQAIAPAVKDMKPEDKRGYTTRESKAR